MFLKFYKGAFSYAELMELPYETFMMFYDYMEYLMNMETKEGQKRNKSADRRLEEAHGFIGIDDDLTVFKNMMRGGAVPTKKK